MQELNLRLQEKLIVEKKHKNVYNCTTICPINIKIGVLRLCFASQSALSVYGDISVSKKNMSHWPNYFEHLLDKANGGWLELNLVGLFNKVWYKFERKWPLGECYCIFQGSKRLNVVWFFAHTHTIYFIQFNLLYIILYYIVFKMLILLFIKSTLYCPAHFNWLHILFYI